MGGEDGGWVGRMVAWVGGWVGERAVGRRVWCILLNLELATLIKVNSTPLLK